MEFELNRSIEILSRTPDVLASMLSGLSDEWLTNNEGEQTWSPYDVVGHLIHGEKTDWIVRSKIMLSNLSDKGFEPFDRFAQLNEPQDTPIEELLAEFRRLRQDNLEVLKNFNLAESDLEKTGVHPEFGEVHLKQLLATWVAHDLGHIAQISRVMAKQYKEEVGPWKKYLRILNG
ncbi:MAG: DinB family protein [Balneolales bacterium]|nr:DinB family protein [Balneolales bacterium]